MNINLKEDKVLNKDQVINLYKANKWSAGEKPKQLIAALSRSDSVITAWHNDELIGLGNAISDGHLVVYYPHLLVHPRYQKKGVGHMIMERLQERYGGFHQQILVANNQAIKFYRKCGFKRAYKTTPMWIFKDK